MTAINPYRISVADDVLADLKSRLRNTRWPEAELVDDWSQGAPLQWIKDVCRYWAEDYDWRRREALLNRFAQFTTEIDGLDIHFLHVRSPHPQRDAADHHPWLAGIGGRIPQGDRAADRSGRAWRQRRGCVSCGLPLAARLRLFGQADRDRLGRRPHCVGLGRADGSPWLYRLRRAGRRLGFGGHHRARRAGRRPIAPAFTLRLRWPRGRMSRDSRRRRRRGR